MRRCATARTSTSSSQANTIDETNSSGLYLYAGKNPRNNPANTPPTITLKVMRRITPAMRSRMRRVNRPIATMAMITIPPNTTAWVQSITGSGEVLPTSRQAS